MKEQQFQSKIIKKLGADGWYVIKLIKTNKNGIPDIVAFKNNEFQFIEVKTDKGVLSELQKFRINELKEKGFTVKIWTDYGKEY
jgi:Holliday junction resolvase